MKEARMCFSEMELIQKLWLSRENKQLFESKGVSKDQKKAGITRHTTGGYFAAHGDNFFLFSLSALLRLHGMDCGDFPPNALKYVLTCSTYSGPCQSRSNCTLPWLIT